MTDPIRVYVGSDERMGKAEIALAHSLNVNSSVPVDITFMRAKKGCETWGECWNREREMHKPYTKGAWATDFTGFRFAVPELAGFEGKAIYLDVDMLVLKDINELFNYKQLKPWMSVAGRTDVSVIDCGAFKDQEWWPSIEKMKKSGWRISQYTSTMVKRNFYAPVLPGKWDCLDGRGFSDSTRLLHFTQMRTQPWKPWPECFKYPPHPSPKAVELFWKYYGEGKAALKEPKESDPVVSVSESEVVAPAGEYPGERPPLPPRPA